MSSKITVDRKIEGMARIAEYDEVIALLNNVSLPIYRPSKSRIMLNLEEIKLYRQGMIYTIDPPKKYGGDDDPPKIYMLNMEDIFD